MPGIDVIASAFSGANAAFIADMYARWVNNPGSVDPSFGELFGALNDEARGVLTDASGASWAPRNYSVAEPEPVVKAAKGVAGGATPEQVRAAATDSLRALMLIRAYRVRGHLEATLDPLGAADAEAASGAGPGGLWVRAGGSGPADLHRRGSGAGDGDGPGDREDCPRELLRGDRRGVHAHPGPGPEDLDPATDRGGRPGCMAWSRRRSGRSCSS